MIAVPIFFGAASRTSRNVPGGRTSRARTLAAVAVVLVLSATVPGPLVARAADEPDLIVPTDGVFKLEGRGYGHGRGMSQWGAQGAALSGIGYREILATYYPGTELSRTREKTLKVRITNNWRRDLRVRPADGLRVRSKSHSRRLPKRIAGEKVSLWRVTELPSGRPRLKAHAGGHWHTVTIDGRRTLRSPVRFRTKPSRGVQIVLSRHEDRHYRGKIYVYTADRTGGEYRVLNKVKIADYLRSVVPSESYPSWEPDALRAQAVAARTYALWRAENVDLGAADICDTTACQVYHGSRSYDGDGNLTRTWEAESTDAAVRHTDDLILTYRGEPALTEFSASNGGYSTDGGKPYLIARADPWDGIAAPRAHAWKEEVKVAAVARAFPDLGQIEGLRVLDRDGNGVWGGRVLEVRVVGSEDSAKVDGHRFASMVGLLHSWWHGLATAPAGDPVPPQPGATAPEAETQQRTPAPTESPTPSPAPTESPTPALAPTEPESPTPAPTQSPTPATGQAPPGGQ